MSFCHLHVHSHYSLLDGLTQIKPLIKAAKNKGFTALALTDTGSLYGVIEFYQECQKQGIKPIVGFEANVTPYNHLDKDPVRAGEVYHLILLARNYAGYKNLMQISSLGHIEGLFNGKPRIDKEILKKYHEGVICLSGCIKGQIPSLIKKGDYESAKKWLLNIKKYLNLIVFI